MIRNIFCLTLAFLTAVACSGNEQPKEPDPIRRKSPIAIASITHKPSDTYVKVVYGQPYARGRQVFGNLEPYGKVWRTGANETTEMTITQPITFNGEQIEAGTYALFSIPRKEKNWTIILNDSLGQWGAFDYNSTYDYLRTDIPSKSIDKASEAFIIQFSEMDDNSSAIILKWDTTKVEIPISFGSAPSKQ